MINSSLLGTEGCLKFWCYCITTLVKHAQIFAWRVCEEQCERGMCEAGVLYYSPVEMT